MSISLVKVISVITFLALVSCGQAKTTAESQTPQSKSQTDQGGGSSQPQTNDEPPASDPAPKSQDRPFTPAPIVEKNNTSTVPTAPPPIKDIPDNNVGINLPPEKPTEVQNNTGLIVALGADGMETKDLINPKTGSNRGFTSAVTEATVCGITGAFSDHRRCYAVFKDGHAENVNSSDKEQRLLITAFIAELQAAADSQKNEKPKGKKKHHFLFL